MATFVSKALAAEPARPLPSFLRHWDLPNPQIASCGNHDHLALIYDEPDEQLDVIVPFLRLGLERGEKSVYIYDDNSSETVIAAMERHGIDVAAATASGALSIITKKHAYLKNGNFDCDWMIGFLAQAVQDAKEKGFKSVRASGEMTWALGPTGDSHDQLVEYECKLNAFFSGYDMGGICQYNRRRFRPETLMHVIHTHPRIIYRGEVCENPRFIPPDIYQGEDGGMENAVRRLLEGMVENARLRRHLRSETEALRYSEKLAAAGRAAATVAHEINNPLASITNLWYLLCQEELPARARDYLRTMGEELNRVSHISKQTLEFYRDPATGGPVDLGLQIEEAVNLLSRQAQAQGAVMQVDLRTPALIFGFAGELRQLFANLIVNALEAGASNIRIRASRSRDWKKPSREGVRVTIADDGPGIPAAVTDKIFEPFFTTKEEKGTGLGLWVSKGIALKHGGTLSVRTSAKLHESGTVFSIFLPGA